MGEHSGLSISSMNTRPTFSHHRKIALAIPDSATDSPRKPRSGENPTLGGMWRCIKLYTNLQHRLIGNHVVVLSNARHVRGYGSGHRNGQQVRMVPSKAPRIMRFSANFCQSLFRSHSSFDCLAFRASILPQTVRWRRACSSMARRVPVMASAAAVPLRGNSIPTMTSVSTQSLSRRRIIWKALGPTPRYCSST